MRRETAWLAPSPLWDRTVADAAAPAPPGLFEPALLRFTRDAFMDEVRAVLAAEPGRLAGYVAAPEPAGASFPVELYEAVHSRHYLVAASLVCRAPGLPERSVDAAAGERASFLLRRIAGLRGGGEAELAWTGDAQSGSWVPLADPLLPTDREERLPLFPSVFASATGRRRLHLGLVPAGRRELYEPGAGAAGGAGVYRLRCLYERPRCRRVAPPVVSAPSAAFRLTGFADERLPRRGFGSRTGAAR